MMLFDGAKKRFCTFVQPPSPSWSMVNSPGRTGNFFRFFSSTLFTTGPVAVVGEDLLGCRSAEEA